MQKLITEKLQQKEKISNFLLIFLLTVVGLLAITRVIIANRTVGVSERLHTLDDQIARNESENSILSENLREKESLVTLQERAVNAGFVSTSNFAYIPKTQPVAFDLNQANP